MQALIHPLTELADYEEIVKNKRKGPGAIRILGCVNSQKTHMMYGLSVMAAAIRLSSVPASRRQSRYMKNTVSWTEAFICIRPRIFCFIRLT